MNKIFIFTFIIFINLIHVLNASIINIKSEFDEPTRRRLYSLVDESIAKIDHKAINVCNMNDYHVTLKGIYTPLSRAKLTMFQEEDKVERFKFENTVDRIHAFMKTLEFEITGAEVLQGPRKQFLVAVIRPLLGNTTYTKNNIDTVLGEVCIHVTLMKAPLNDNDANNSLKEYKNLINKYITSAAIKPVTVAVTVAEMAYNQPLYSNR